MNRARAFMIEVMGRYSECVESYCICVGEYVEKACEYITKYGKCLLAGLAVVLGYLFLALTMPIWYLPYKYFIKKL